MSISKKSARLLRDAHDLFAETHGYRQGDMHRAGRSMLKEAAGHVRTVLVTHAGEKGAASPDDLAARLIGALAGGKSISPPLLVTLGEVVDRCRWELPERILEAAVEDGELTW